jgi:hypothetical protein
VLFAPTSIVVNLGEQRFNFFIPKLKRWPN